MGQTTVVLFGITGDLSRRKLLPVLQSIMTKQEIPAVRVLGVSRRPLTVEELLQETLGNATLAPRFSAHTMDVADANEYQKLKTILGSSDPVVIYLAVPPGAAAQIVDFLGEAGITTPNIKILFEKPFGYDLVSAQDFIGRTARFFSEEQLYRIDHYMAKDVALRLLALRSDAANHHHAWDRTSVAAVEVIASETIGVEGRGEFYEQTGALRDVVQGHLMQLLSLVLLRMPSNFVMTKLPQYRVTALHQLRVADSTKAWRGQYDGYAEEVSNLGSTTETFVRLELESDDERWQGVPLTLITGKALDQKRTQVIVTYHDGTRDVFDEDELRRDPAQPDAYERVIVEAIESRRNIFTSSEEVIESWRVLAAVQEQWSLDSAPLEHYAKGASLDQLG